MNEHVYDTQELADQSVDLADQLGTPDFGGLVQDDSDYHVDPLDKTGYDDGEINAFGSATALDEAEGLCEVNHI